MIRALWPLALLSAALPSTAWANALTVQASLSDTSVVVGDMVTVEVEAVATISGDVEIEVPQFAGLNEVGRRSSESSQFSITNAGRSMKRTRTLTIDYEATTPGRHTLTAITARVGTRGAAAAPVVIEVVENKAALAVKARPGEIEPPRPEEKNLFVRFRADKAQVYLGQQILLDMEIFTNGSFNLDQQYGLPTLDGFWNEIVEQPQRLTARNVRVGRKQMRAYRLWRAALFPLQAGERRIEGDALAFSQNRSIFNSGTRLRRAPLPLTVDVLPLPTEGRPTGFSSTNVGEYRLTATVDRTRVPAGKAVVLEVRLEGRGNIKSTKLPEIAALDGFRVFPATSRDDVQKGRLGITGYKEAERILMPLRGGRLEIPSFSLPVFSPTKEAYEVLTTSSIRIMVDGDPQLAPTARSPTPSASASPQPAPGGIPRAKLQPLRYRSALVDRAPPLATRPIFAALLGAPPLLFLLFLLGEGLIARTKRETPTSKRKKAARAAHARLAAARAAAAEGDAAKAYAEIAETLYAFASERAQCPIRGMTLTEAKHALGERGAPQALVDQLIAELEHCDFARFAPGGLDAATVAEALERGSAVLSALEAWSPTERGS